MKKENNILNKVFWYVFIPLAIGIIIVFITRYYLNSDEKEKLKLINADNIKLDSIYTGDDIRIFKSELRNKNNGVVEFYSYDSINGMIYLKFKNINDNNICKRIAMLYGNLPYYMPEQEKEKIFYLRTKILNKDTNDMKFGDQFFTNYEIKQNGIMYDSMYVHLSLTNGAVYFHYYLLYENNYGVYDIYIIQRIGMECLDKVIDGVRKKIYYFAMNEKIEDTHRYTDSEEKTVNEFIHQCNEIYNK